MLESGKNGWVSNINHVVQTQLTEKKREKKKLSNNGRNLTCTTGQTLICTL